MIAEAFDVVVIGGGPAGSTVASFLHLMGQQVLLFERERFPRHHIGESMIAATLDVLGEVGLTEKLDNAGFPVKSGGCFIWGESDKPWCIRFDEVPGRPTSYQVKRDVFDKLLLDHSKELGVDVREEHRVTSLLQEEGRVVGILWENAAGEQGEARARITVDASGLNAVIANKLSQRIAAEELKNMALYGYWAGEHPAPVGLGGEIRPQDRNNIIIKWVGEGWLWFIPLGFDQKLISVGYVTPRSTLPESGGRAALEARYLERIKAAEEFQYLLSNSEYTGEFHTIKDWSYRSEAMAGPGYFAVGDAACFVDPILSSGAYLAVLYAKMCAVGVNTCLREEAPEALVQEWYEALYNDTYVDYLQMARFWYHGNRKVSEWMHEAQDATTEDTEFAGTDRSSFIGLATGNTHAHPNYVHVQGLASLPLRVRLRKDPRGGFHKEAQNALVAHAGVGHEQKESTQKAMAKSRAMKGAISQLLQASSPVVDRLPGDPVTLDDVTLGISSRADVTIEMLDDLVRVVVGDGKGHRRRLAATEIELLGALSRPAKMSEVAARTGRPDNELRGFFEELVGAGVLEARASSLGQ